MLLARIKKHITLDDNARGNLTALYHSGDVELAARAQMILMSADRTDLTDEDLAKLLNVSRPTLRKWRDRYLTDGIDGLRTVTGGGRPPKVLSPVELGAALEAVMTADEERDWDVSELAAHFSVSPSTVHRALNGSDSPLKRRHIWTYRTRDVLCDAGDHLLAIYLSHDEQMVIIGHTAENLSGCTAYGSFVTQDRELYCQLQNSPGILGVLDTLVGATNRPGDCQRGLMPSIGTVADGVLEEWTTTLMRDG